MQRLVLLIILTAPLLLHAQVNYGTPNGTEALPDKFNGLRRAIDLAHFPSTNHPVEEDGTYYWKHATSVLCNESPLEVIEYGAYLFYNGKWNLRKSYPLEELQATFGIRKNKMQQAQPYTWTDNWRVGNDLFGGWAMWYFIGMTTDGEKVYGYATIETTDQLLTSK